VVLPILLDQYIHAELVNQRGIGAWRAAQRAESFRKCQVFGCDIVQTGFMMNMNVE